MLPDTFNKQHIRETNHNSNPIPPRTTSESVYYRLFVPLRLYVSFFPAMDLFSGYGSFHRLWIFSPANPSTFIEGRESFVGAFSSRLDKSS